MKKKVEIDRTFLGFIDIFKGFLTKSFLYGTSAIWYNINWKSWIESSVPKRSEVAMLRLFCFHFQSSFCFAIIRFAFMRLFSLTLTQFSIRLLLLHQLSIYQPTGHENEVKIFWVARIKTVVPDLM